MTKDEALKLALEALETPWNAPYVDGCDLALGKRVKAITAIKEALANEALEKMAENARELGLDYEPEQEPVTCVEYIPCCTDQTCSKCKAATQPQRKPLTDEEERKAFEQWYVCNAFDYERNPIGSRECGLQWSAWKARAAHGIKGEA